MRYVAVTILLLATLALGQSWVVEQIDSAAASASPVELVKAADGRLWAGYQTKSGVVRVACLGDSGWSIADVCTGSLQMNYHARPFLAASPHGELCLACFPESPDTGGLFRKVGDTWRNEPYPLSDTVPLGTIAYDTAGRLYTLHMGPWTADFWVAHESDSGWTPSFVVQLPYYAYWYLFWVAHLTVAADDSPWFFGFSGWDDHPYKWDYATDLLHFSGDSWESVWMPGGSGGLPPMPAALVPYGDGVGNLTTFQDLILCDSEPITACPYFLPAAGLAYTADGLPLAAWVPSDQAAGPFFAFRTNWWHVESIPGPAGIGGLDIDVDTAGRVVVAYATQASGLWCARRADVVGGKESPKPQAPTRRLEPTVMRRLPPASVAFDAMGRRVVNPRSGIYFVRGEGHRAGDVGRTRKVVIQR
jgi:hypothetical protein